MSIFGKYDIDGLAHALRPRLEAAKWPLSIGQISAVLGALYMHMSGPTGPCICRDGDGYRGNCPIHGLDAPES
jgi:hypothetical protein